MEKFDIYSKNLVVDLGSATIKAGLANDETPRCVFESVRGTPTMTSVMPTSVPQRTIGLPDSRNSTMRYERLIKRGVLVHPETGRDIVKRSLEDLKIKVPEEVCIFLAESNNAPAKQKRILTEIFLEQMNLSGVCFGNQAVLSLFSEGRTTGCVLEVGEGVTQCAAIIDGHRLRSGSVCTELGGQDIDQYLSRLLLQKGISFRPHSEFTILRELKEKTCEVVEVDSKNLLDSPDFSPNHKTFTTPDGEELIIEKEQLLAPETLFRPEIAGVDRPGIHELLASVLLKVDIDIVNSLLRHIFLSGGSSQFKGLTERFSNELRALLPPHSKISVSGQARVNRAMSAWVGAAKMSLLPEFAKLYVTKTEFADFGESIIERKCF